MGTYWSDRNKRNKESRDLPNNLTKKNASKPRAQQDHLHLTTSVQHLGGEDLTIILNKIRRTHNIQYLNSFFHRWAEGNTHGWRAGNTSYQNKQEHGARIRMQYPSAQRNHF